MPNVVEIQPEPDENARAALLEALEALDGKSEPEGLWRRAAREEAVDGTDP